jgi:hypothetical protein
MAEVSGDRCSEVSGDRFSRKVKKLVRLENVKRKRESNKYEHTLCNNVAEGEDLTYNMAKD